MSTAMCAAVLLAAGGCGQRWKLPLPKPKPDGVRLLTLTVLESGTPDDDGVVRAFVEPAGAESQAAWYRFELYHFAPLTANPRGRRIVLWPDVEPGQSSVENPRWRPHLRAYEFALPLEAALSAEGTYLLEVTALTVDGHRYSDTLKISPKRK